MDAERCDGAMGCNGERCMWSASKSGCQDWCRYHAVRWAGCVAKAIRAVSDSNMAAMLMVDRLNFDERSIAPAASRGCFTRGSPADVCELIWDDRGREEGSFAAVASFVETLPMRERISSISLRVTACGLTGDPSDEELARWETSRRSTGDRYRSADGRHAEESVWIRKFSDDEFLITDRSGVFRRVDEASATAEIADVMSDRRLRGTRMIFSFDVSTVGWTPSDVRAAFAALEIVTPEGRPMIRSASGYGIRTFSYRPDIYGISGSSALGGVHVALDCGDFIAQWHTFSHVEVDFPISAGSSDPKVAFRITMLW